MIAGWRRRGLRVRSPVEEAHHRRRGRCCWCSRVVIGEVAADVVDSGRPGGSSSPLRATSSRSSRSSTSRRCSPRPCISSATTPPRSDRVGLEQSSRASRRRYLGQSGPAGDAGHSGADGPSAQRLLRARRWPREPHGGSRMLDRWPSLSLPGRARRAGSRAQSAAGPDRRGRQGADARRPGLPHLRALPAPCQRPRSPPGFDVGQRPAGVDHGAGDELGRRAVEHAEAADPPGPRRSSRSRCSRRSCGSSACRRPRPRPSTTTTSTTHDLDDDPHDLDVLDDNLDDVHDHDDFDVHDHHDAAAPAAGLDLRSCRRRKRVSVVLVVANAGNVADLGHLGLGIGRRRDRRPAGIPSRAPRPTSTSVRIGRLAPGASVEVTLPTLAVASGRHLHALGLGRHRHPPARTRDDAPPRASVRPTR